MHPKHVTTSLPSRRTILRAAGVCLSLPALESLAGNGLQAAEPGAAKVSPRLMWIYNPHGPANEFWRPEGSGRDYKLSRTLQTMSDWRQHMTVLSGPTHGRGGGGGHHMVSRMLTGVTAEDDIQFGPVTRSSVDQIAAELVADQTRFPSLQLSVAGGTGPTDRSRTMSFNRSGRAMPAMQNPRKLFQRLFVPHDAKSLKHAEHIFAKRRSLLDSIRDQLHGITADVGVDDQRRLAQFQDSVRDVERQLQRDQDWSKVEKPKMSDEGLDFEPANRIEWIDAINAIAVLALQTDSTRLISMVYGLEGSYYDWREVKGNKWHHHGLQHHNGEQKRIEAMSGVDSIKLQAMARMLKRMSEVQTPTGSLLDQTMIWYGHGMNNGTPNYGRGKGGHTVQGLSHLVLGGSALGVKHGKHLDYGVGEMPLCNLWITMLQKFGVDIEHYVDSTGGLDDLLTA